ncbi:MAG: NnrU family protein [Gammaproteobacteria bacterium]|nr:NnrU family protein [Gammaproteobacteria bacterium]
MTELVLAAVAFCGSHLGIAGTPVRGMLVGMIGERGYLIAYSVLSLLLISWLADSYKVAPYVETWGQLYALQIPALILMFLAFLLVVIGLTTPSPTLVGAEGLLEKENVVKGILRITRHPFLMGVALWSLTHLIVNGDLASLILFGSLFLLVVPGAYSIDGKRAAKMGDQWRSFAMQTSVIPFAAIVQGRNQLSIRELGWWRILLAVVAFLGFLMYHMRLFGVSPVSALH